MGRRPAELSKSERRELARLVKSCAIPLTGTLGFRKAEVTSGGVRLDEVDSRTMESKLAKNLFLAGELLDLDGPIGGYNFQAAFSTGWLAGESAGGNEEVEPGDCPIRVFAGCHVRRLRRHVRWVRLPAWLIRWRR